MDKNELFSTLAGLAKEAYKTDVESQGCRCC